MSNEKNFALVDCNNFYASCEKIFQPNLNDKPVVILSNNDGCIIARSNEAKDLKIPMGAPYHQYRRMMEQNHVKAFSSNYTLYGDISSRVMQSLAMMAPNMEVYSIDEAFLRITEIENGDLIKFCADVRNNIQRWIGIPTSIGIAPTKTLAKMANTIAKKQGRKLIKKFSDNYNFACAKDHVFDLRDEQLRKKILEEFDLKDIWGISQASSSKLNRIGIYTALDLCNSNSRQVRSILGVVGERIVYELRGISCLGLQDISPRKSIMSSRSFGRKVTKKEELIEAISSYATRAHEKLKHQKSIAQAIHVYIRTNHFSINEAQYQNGITKSFARATDSLSEIIKMAREAINDIYQPDFNYKKAGIILLDLVPRNQVQENLLILDDAKKREKIEKLENAMSLVNQNLGRNTIFYAALGTKKNWAMQSNNRSPSYTTNIKEIPYVS